MTIDLLTYWLVDQYLIARTLNFEHRSFYVGAFNSNAIRISQTTDYAVRQFPELLHIAQE